MTFTNDKLASYKKASAVSQKKEPLTQSQKWQKGGGEMDDLFVVGYNTIRKEFTHKKALCVLFLLLLRNRKKKKRYSPQKKTPQTTKNDAYCSLVASHFFFALTKLQRKTHRHHSRQVKGVKWSYFTAPRSLPRQQSEKLIWSDCSFKKKKKSPHPFLCHIGIIKCFHPDSSRKVYFCVGDTHSNERTSFVPTTPTPTCVSQASVRQRTPQRKLEKKGLFAVTQNPCTNSWWGAHSL